MNERIKEFVFEARLITVDGITRYASDYEFETRFAGMIIKECCQKLENDGMVEIAIEMKQHFGVE